jgi:hypothetical protein
MTTEKTSETMHNTGSLGFWVFIVVCAYFGFALYMFVPSALFANELISHYAVYQELIKVPWWLVLFYASELGGGVGGALRLVAGFFALYSTVLFWRKKESAIPLIGGKVGTALLLEGSYYLSFIPSVVLGFVFLLTGGRLWYFDTTPVMEVFFVAGVACLLMVMAIPPLLFKLRSKILQCSSSQDIVKWSCLTCISYLFVVFWFNSSMQWVGMITTFGTSVLLDPIGLAGFLASVFGLFLIAIFRLMSTLPAIKKLPVKLSLRHIGVVMMALGGYFMLGMLLYVLAGGFAERPFAWYEMMVPHNPYLWCVIFLFVGLPLVARRKNR